MKIAVQYPLEIFFDELALAIDSYKANNMLLMTLLVALLKSGRNYA
jgi:hypothetical protein